MVLARVSYTVYSGCDYPRLFQKILMVYMLSLITFFSNFFYHAYIRRMPASRRAKVEVNGKAVSNGKVTDGSVVPGGDGDQLIVHNGVKGKTD